MKRFILIITILFTILFLFVGNVFAKDISLMWDANTEPDLAGYKLYYGLESGKYDDPITIPLIDLLDVTNPAYILSGLSDGVFHYVVATAYDLEGLESDYSNEVLSFDGKKPQKVKGFRRFLQLILSFFNKLFRNNLRLS